MVELVQLVQTLLPEQAVQAVNAQKMHIPVTSGMQLLLHIKVIFLFACIILILF